VYTGDFARLRDIEDANQVKIPVNIPILPLRDFVVFPHMVSPLIIARAKSLKMIEDAISELKIIGLVAQKEPGNEDPDKKALFRFGTAAFILKTLRFPDNSTRILVQGLSRIKISRFTQQDPYFKANVKPLHDSGEANLEVEALPRNIVNQFQKS